MKISPAVVRQVSLTIPNFYTMSPCSLAICPWKLSGGEGEKKKKNPPQVENASLASLDFSLNQLNFPKINKHYPYNEFWEIILTNLANATSGFVKFPSTN